MILLLIPFITLFHPIAETIPDGPFSYEGKNPREILIVDPENSPLLDKAYLDITSEITDSNTEEDILEWVCFYVREKLFDPTRSKDIDQWIQVGERIPLETYLEAKVGICRHHALATTLLIDRLIKNGLLCGKAYLIRDEVPFGRHGWTLFLSDDGAWHLDPYLGFLENGKTSSGFLRLCQKYGKHTMDQQKTRWSDGG